MRYGTGAGGSAINITAGDIEWPHAVVLRTEPGGSIIDARPIDGFWVHANSEGFYPVVEKTEDGSRIIRNTMIARKLPESVVLYTWFIIGGVTFDDGAGARNNTLADFLPDGEMAYYLVISPSGYGACHGISAYQNGAYLGRR